MKFFLPLAILAIYLHGKNQCHPDVPSGDIYDQIILQSNWLKDFPAITQEQEFWNLWSKIDNNKNFPTKINENIFQDKGILRSFWPYFVIFIQRGFFTLNLANYNWCGLPTLNVKNNEKQKTVPSISACKIRSIKFIKSACKKSIHFIDLFLR